jgi:uncharacterized tellurite resistance protein B-like protein
MLGRIKEILGKRLGPGDDPAALQHRRRVATAALLFAVARADEVQDAREENAMRAALRRTQGLTDEELEELLVQAAQELADASSDYPFTRLINDTFSDEEKSNLIREMWRVAYADEDLHKYEEHLIRKIAVLIYVTHSEFIRAKLDMARESGASVS